MTVEDMIDRLNECDLKSEVYIAPDALPGDETSEVENFGDMVEIR